LIDNQRDFDTQFPVTFEDRLSLDEKRNFARSFVAARDAVEGDYYAGIDKTVSAQQRTRRFLGALIDPAIGRSVRDVEAFYQTFGRLMRWAWLSVSVGIYSPEIGALDDVAQRLHIAQVNTVDTAWRLAYALQKPQLIVEIGTGRGNSIARLAQLFPQAQIVSITISPEQCEISRQLMQTLGVTNVEVRLGDLFDEGVTADLVGAADAVTAIEVTGHFAHERKAQGIGFMARLLKPGAPLSLLDSSLRKPLPPMLVNYYTNQKWYFGTREVYLGALQAAGLTPIAYIDYAQDTLQTFIDTTTVLRRHRARLREEFGGFMALVWPELPHTVYLSTVKMLDYVHIVGVKGE
jgi:cyclopropane fatty-acyl-phospholipid synthase-like methyltransferase